MVVSYDNMSDLVGNAYARSYIAEVTLNGSCVTSEYSFGLGERVFSAGVEAELKAMDVSSILSKTDAKYYRVVSGETKGITFEGLYVRPKYTSERIRKDEENNTQHAHPFKLRKSFSYNHYSQLYSLLQGLRHTHVLFDALLGSSGVIATRSVFGVADTVLSINLAHKRIRSTFEDLAPAGTDEIVVTTATDIIVSALGRLMYVVEETCPAGELLANWQDIDSVAVSVEGALHATFNEMAHVSLEAPIAALPKKKVANFQDLKTLSKILIDGLLENMKECLEAFRYTAQELKSALKRTLALRLSPDIARRDETYMALTRSGTHLDSLLNYYNLFYDVITDDHALVPLNFMEIERLNQLAKAILDCKRLSVMTKSEITHFKMKHIMVPDKDLCLATVFRENTMPDSYSNLLFELPVRLVDNTTFGTMSALSRKTGGRADFSLSVAAYRDAVSVDPIIGRQYKPLDILRGDEVSRLYDFAHASVAEPEISAAEWLAKLLVQWQVITRDIGTDSFNKAVIYAILENGLEIMCQGAEITCLMPVGNRKLVNLSLPVNAKLYTDDPLTSLATSSENIEPVVAKKTLTGVKDLFENEKFSFITNDAGCLSNYDDLDLSAVRLWAIEKTILLAFLKTQPATPAAWTSLMTFNFNPLKDRLAEALSCLKLYKNEALKLDGIRKMHMCLDAYHFRFVMYEAIGNGSKQLQSEMLQYMKLPIMDATSFEAMIGRYVEATVQSYAQAWKSWSGVVEAEIDEWAVRHIHAPLLGEFKTSRYREFLAKQAKLAIIEMMADNRVSHAGESAHSILRLYDYLSGSSSSKARVSAWARHHLRIGDGL